MKIVHSPASFINAFSRHSRRRCRPSASHDVYIEKYFDNARHVESVMGYRHGNCPPRGPRLLHPARHQKLIEESPAPALPVRVRNRMWKAAIDAASA